MRTLLPRLRNLLAMLAAESEPLPVKEVADRLRVSKRTVFRELAGIGSVLGGYDLEIGSRPGEGIVLEGLPQARRALAADLEKQDRSDPADRRDRRDRLVLAILQSPGQKLAVHAERFRVSAPTVSRDLDDIEPWLAERGLTLARRPGAGIFIEGGEMAVRRTVLTLLYRMEEPGTYPHPDILLDLNDLASELDPLLGWMTPQSRDALNRYMSVAAQRIMDGNSLEDPGSAGAREEEFAPEAIRLAAVLAEAFNIRPGQPEIAALEIELASCRPSVPGGRRGGNDAALAAIAGEMATLFDPAQAALFRMDEALMEGLLCHLRTATVRLRHRIELVDPMREEIARSYPDVMLRCRAACGALPGCGGWLPESEVSLLAAHFAAAQQRLSDRGARRRTVRVGVICVHGIGSSYLLASQVKRAFGERALVEVGWHGDSESRRQYDVLVSTTELPGADVPVVVVPPIPGEDGIRRVGEALARARSAPDAPGGARGSFAGDLRTMEALFAGAGRLMERFSLAAAPPGADVAELMRIAGGHFGGTAEAAAAIGRELAAREAVSTQVIPELRIVLLHCRTAGTDSPLFGVMRPDGGAFTDPSLRGALSCVVMLLPERAPREQSEMMGCLSTALVEREGFLAAVRTGGVDEVREALERIVGEFLFQSAVHRLKG